MDIDVLRMAVMVIGLIVFVGIVYWTYGPQRRDRFQRAALSVFDEEPYAAHERADKIAKGGR